MAKKRREEKIIFKVIKTERKEAPKDYLKFYKVVRYWVKRKHNLSGPELDMLLFLRSEYLFTKTDFEDYYNIFSWSTTIFNDLLRDGWIRNYRKASTGKYAIYELSAKGKRLVSDVYKKCEGIDDFSEVGQKNPVFNRAHVNYADKVFSSQMKKINVINKEARKKE